MSQPTVKDVRVEVKVRNNLVLSMMEERKISTVAELCRRMGKEYKQNVIGKLINMKRSARDKKGGWEPHALALADFFQCLPEDLFSEFQQEEALETNRSHAEIAYTEIAQLTGRNQGGTAPELEYQAQQLRATVRRALESLPAREERVLRMRFGFDDGVEKSVEKIAATFGVSYTRIYQIECRALRRLRQPSRRNALRDVVAGSGKRSLDEDLLDTL